MEFIIAIFITVFVFGLLFIDWYIDLQADNERLFQMRMRAAAFQYSLDLRTENDN